MRNYKKYDVWKLSHELVKEIYIKTESFPKTEMFGLVSQIRRAAVSIPVNITEGCGRFSDKEFARFLEISIGSTNETEYLVIISSELHFINETDSNTITEKLNLIRQKLIQLRKKLLEVSNDKQ
jgi:four helix bundle protein